MCEAVQHFRNQQICHINFLKMLNIVFKDYLSTSSFQSEKYHMLNLKALQHHAGKFFHSYYFKLEVHLRYKIKATVTCVGTSLSDLEKQNASCIDKLTKYKKLLLIWDL